MRTTRMRLWIWLLLGLAILPPGEAVERVVVNTDIGHDIDDVVALSLLLKSAEVEVLAVVTSGSEGEKRARTARHLLYLLGRDEIPVAAGPGAETDRIPVGPIYHFSEDFGRVPPPELDGVNLLLETIKSAGGKVTVISLGPLTSLAGALSSDPSVAEKVSAVICSPGSRPDWEYFRRDPSSTGRVVAAVDTFEVALPGTRAGASWSDVDLAQLDGLPLGRVLQEMAVCEQPEPGAWLLDTQVAAYCIRKKLMNSRSETLSPEAIGLATGAFEPRDVVVLDDADLRGIRQLLTDRMRDPLPTIVACLERVQAHNADLTPALSAPLSEDLFAIRRLAREIMSRDRLRTPERQAGMRTIHRLLKSLEIVQEHKAGRNMIQRLSLASALLGDIRISFPAEYRETGHFKGILGDRAEVTVGVQNRGPFDIPRARFTVFDWTLRKPRSESVIDLRSGLDQSRTFAFPLPVGEEYPDYLRAHVLLEWQFEAGWAKLPYEVWIKVLPPFAMQPSEPPKENELKLVVRPLMSRRQQVLLRIEPLRGQWTIPENERTINFLPASDDDTGSVFSLINGKPVREELVTFAIPPLPRGELNAVRISASNATYQSSMEVVFPYPGSGVVWLPNAGHESLPIERVAGQWALFTDPKSGDRHLHYKVIDPLLGTGQTSLEIEVDYYDAGNAQDCFAIQFDSTMPGEGEDRYGESVTAEKPGKEGWHSHRFVLPQVYVGGGDSAFPDFRIWDAGDGREVIGRVSVLQARP